MKRISGVRQCLLRRGNVEQVAWIPDQFAITGNWLRLLDRNGWQVITVYAYLPSVAQHHGYFAGGIFHESEIGRKGV